MNIRSLAVFGALFASGAAYAAAPGVLFEWPDRVLIRDATGAARILEKPVGSVVVAAGNGSVILKGGMRLTLGAGTSVPFEMSKLVTKANVVKWGLKFGRLYGPIGIASLALETIQWIDGKWVKREEVDWKRDDGVHPFGWGCNDVGYGQSVFTFMPNSVTKVELIGIHTGEWGNGQKYQDGKPWFYSNTCPKLPMVDGNLRAVIGRVVQTMPSVEDIPYREVTDSELSGEIDKALDGSPAKAADIVTHGFSRGGESQDLSPQEYEPIKGPDHVDGPSTTTTTTTTTPGGGTSTTTNNTTYNFTTNNTTINITSTTTSTTTHQDGSTTTTTTTNNTATGGEGEPANNPSSSGGTSTKPGSGGGTVSVDITCANVNTCDDADTGGPLPSVPKLYTPKYPDGLVGVWSAKKDGFSALPLVRLASDLMPKMDSGTPPYWQIDVDFGNGWNFGSYVVSPDSSVWPILRSIVIVLALIFAFRLVFGGA